MIFVTFSLLHPCMVVQFTCLLAPLTPCSLPTASFACALSRLLFLLAYSLAPKLVGKWNTRCPFWAADPIGDDVLENTGGKLHPFIHTYVPPQLKLLKLLRGSIRLVEGWFRWTDGISSCVLQDIVPYWVHCPAYTQLWYYRLWPLDAFGQLVSDCSVP